MEDLFSELVPQQISGAALIQCIRQRCPEATLDDVLDLARKINSTRIVERLKALNFKTIFEVIDWVRTIDSNPEEIFEIMATNSDGAFSEVLAVHASVLIDSGIVKVIPGPVKPKRRLWCFRPS